MESTVGYSEGQGTRIATHAIDMGDLLPEHHQRFAVGTGVLNLMQVMYPTSTGTGTAGVVSCKGSGRIVIAALCSTTGLIFKVNFYDKNYMDLGCSDPIEITDLSGEMAYNKVTPGWVASKLYAANELVKISSNSHVYMNIAMSGGEYISGTSGTTEPTWPTDGTSVVDNEVLWKDLGDYTLCQTTPLLVFSNSMGAAYFAIKITTNSGTTTFFADSI